MDYIYPVLNEACKKGDVEKVESIISSQNDVTYSLIIALNNNHDEIVLFILTWLNKVHGGKKELWIWQQKWATSNFLKQQRRGWNYNYAIHEAAKEGKEEIVSYFDWNGAKVDDRNKNGYTPLHVACANGQRQMIDMLLRLGALNNFNFTLVMESIQSGELDLLMYLLSMIGSRILTNELPAMLSESCGKSLEVFVEISFTINNNNSDCKIHCCIGKHWGDLWLFWKCCIWMQNWCFYVAPTIKP